MVNPHPTVLLALASVAVSLCGVPLYWAEDAQPGALVRSIIIALTVIAMVLAALAVRIMFRLRWQDCTHPSVLMGACAVAIAMTAVPLRYTGNPDVGPPHPGFFIAIAVLAMLFASSCVATAFGRVVPEPPSTSGCRTTRSSQ